MRSERKNRRYGLEWPPLGDNEEDWAVYTVCVCVYVCKGWSGEVGGHGWSALRKWAKRSGDKVRTMRFVCVYLCACVRDHELFVRFWKLAFATYPFSCQSFMFMHERERENSLTRWHFTAPLFVSQTSSILWVIAHSDLCLLSSPLITFTRCYCQCRDRQPTKMPPSETFILPLHYPYTFPGKPWPLPNTFSMLSFLVAFKSVVICIDLALMRCGLRCFWVYLIEDGLFSPVTAQVWNLNFYSA